MILNRWVPQEVKAVYRIDAAQHILSGLYVGVCLHLLAYIADKAGASWLQYAFVFSAPFIGCLFVSMWVRRSMRGRRMRFILTMRGTGRTLLLSIAFMELPRDMWWFCLVVIVVNALEWGTSPAQVDVHKAIFPSHLFGRMLGFLTFEFHLAVAFAAVLTGVLIKRGIPGLLDSVPFQMIVPWGVASGILALIVYARLPFPDDLPLIPKPVQRTGAAATPVLKNRLFRHVLMMHMTFGFANLGVNGLYPLLHNSARMGGTEETAGYLQGITLLALVGSSFVWALLLDRANKLRMLSIAILCCALGLVGYMLAQNLWQLIAAHLFLGFAASGCWVVPMKIVTSCAGPADVQRYWATVLVLLGVRGVIAPQLAIGLYHEIGTFTPIFIPGLAIMLAALVYNEIALRRPGLSGLDESGNLKKQAA